MAASPSNGSCDKKQDSSSSSSSSAPPLAFSKYNMTMVVELCSSGHCSVPETYVQCSWGSGKFYTEQLDTSGDVMFREFATDADSFTLCQRLGDHSFCYLQTTGSENPVYSISKNTDFSIEGLSLVRSEVSCSDLFDGQHWEFLRNRQLEKCDYYSGVEPRSTFGNTVTYQVVVESGSNYPVYRAIKLFNRAVSITQTMSAFQPGAPPDESKLQPFPDVRIYDFRDGEGDCIQEPSFKSRSYEGKGIHEHMKTTHIHQAIRQSLHLPLKPISHVNLSHTRRVVPRDPRDIPAQFDAREQWPDCADIIGIIVNQGSCGSCWAMASSSVVSDRLCIAKGKKMRLSPQYMMYCQTRTCGCTGGSTIPLWEELMTEGIVPEDCVPYNGHDGICPEMCYNFTPINDDMKIRVDGYVLPWGKTDEARVQAIQSEIMEHGSVAAAFITFSDFPSSGVYHRHKDAKANSGHFVRIIGWGSENGDDYWLVANSWGSNRGDNGYFKIHRGNNECNIEEEVSAGFFNN